MNALGWPSLLLVAGGGALGSVLRYCVSVLAIEMLGTAFPWGTLAVNVLGSAAIGALGGLGVAGEWRLLLVTGLLWQRAWWLSVVYVAASLTLGLAAFALCFWLARRSL